MSIFEVKTFGHQVGNVSYDLFGWQIRFVWVLSHLSLLLQTPPSLKTHSWNSIQITCGVELRVKTLGRSNIPAAVLRSVAQNQPRIRLTYSKMATSLAMVEWKKIHVCSDYKKQGNPFWTRHFLRRGMR